MDYVPSKEEDIKPARKYTLVVSLRALPSVYQTTQTPCGACYVHAQRTFSILLLSSVRTGTQAQTKARQDNKRIDDKENYIVE